MLERRFQTAEREEPTDERGLVLGDDGVVRVVTAGGGRAALGGAQPALHGAVIYGVSGTWEADDGSAIPIAFVDYDTDGYFDALAGGVTIPSDLAGAYLFTAWVKWHTTATLPSQLSSEFDFGDEPNLSGPSVNDAPTVSEGTWGQMFSATGQFAVGDTIRIIIRFEDDFSGTLDIQNVHLSVTYLGPVA